MRLTLAALFGIVTCIGHGCTRAEGGTARPRQGVDLSQRIISFGPHGVLEREATKEGRAVIYGALGIDRVNLFIEPFEKKYPNVKIDFVRLSESDLADKLLLESRTRRINSDVRHREHSLARSD